MMCLCRILVQLMLVWSLSARRLQQGMLSCGKARRRLGMASGVQCPSLNKSRLRGTPPCVRRRNLYHVAAGLCMGVEGGAAMTSQSIRNSLILLWCGHAKCLSCNMEGKERRMLRMMYVATRLRPGGCAQPGGPPDGGMCHDSPATRTTPPAALQDPAGANARISPSINADRLH